jgi:hypothetical protein
MPQSLSRIYLHIIFSTKNRDHIRRQEEHHRKLTFQDEYRAFLQKHSVDFDECYVWDREGSWPAERFQRSYLRKRQIPGLCQPRALMHNPVGIGRMADWMQKMKTAVLSGAR